MNNKSDAIDVDATGGDISCNKYSISYSLNSLSVHVRTACDFPLCSAPTGAPVLRGCLLHALCHVRF